MITKICLNKEDIEKILAKHFNTTEKSVCLEIVDSYVGYPETKVREIKAEIKVENNF